MNAHALAVLELPGVLALVAERASSLAGAERLRALAHSLKGSCRNVGARQLAESCQCIESLAYEDQLDEVPGALIGLQAALDATRLAFLGPVH